MGGVAAVVMAAGKGTRMKSNIPKVLHKICGKPLVAHVIQALRDAGIDDITVVVGHGREMVEEALGSSLKYVYQEHQLGTGHAVLEANGVVDQEKTVLVVSGDTPLLTPLTLQKLVECQQQTGAKVAVLTAVLDNPAGYGRIVRSSQGIVEKIVEDKDASQEQQSIGEINSGTYCFAGKFLFEGLAQVSPMNAQQEYYLTDLVGMAAEAGEKVEGLVCADQLEIQGINSREQLAQVAGVMNYRHIQRLMTEGVTVVDPLTTYIDAGVSVGRDSVILPFCLLQGNTSIGEECTIGPQSRLINVSVGNRSVVENSVAKDAVIGDDCIIGPFAYLRPDTVLGANVKIGDFVEIKKSFVDEGSKIPHLSYVGDSHVGRNVNVGAGTITCNYDGKTKSSTQIGDGAFVGSNTNLVAPVKVGSGAMIAAGSTITKDVPPNSLGVARNKQVNIENWASASKK